MRKRLPLFLALIVPLFVEGQERVADAPENIRPILIGATIPDLSLANLDGKPVQLMDMVHQKPTILIYYRGG